MAFFYVLINIIDSLLYKRFVLIILIIFYFHLLSFRFEINIIWIHINSMVAPLRWIFELLVPSRSHKSY